MAGRIGRGGDVEVRCDVRICGGIGDVEQDCWGVAGSVVVLLRDFEGYGYSVGGV